MHRRDLFNLGVAAGFGSTIHTAEVSAHVQQAKQLSITRVRVTPIALPDPPLLAAGGCHGPYFLRNIVEIETDAGLTGIGETHGGDETYQQLQATAKQLVGTSPFSYRRWADRMLPDQRRAYAGIEVACLDAVGKACRLRLCDLLGGPVRTQIEFASYLFYRYAADHPKLLNDPRTVDERGRGDKALDKWGEVRTPEAMADLAWKFHQKWGFRVHKLKAGVLPPDVELESLRAINDRFGGKHPLRIDPNGRWKVETALKIGKQMKDLPIEYYEDPVAGQQAMGEVRRKTGLKMSTNSCVTSFDHIPQAVVHRPVDVILCDHHYWGGIPACQALGTIASSFNWQLSQHSNNHAGITMAAMTHVSACTPNLTLASDTHYPWLIEGADIIEGGNVPIKNGAIAIPSGHGLGVSIDKDQLAKAHEVYRKCGMKKRDDAATMRRVEPGWTRTLF